MRKDWFLVQLLWAAVKWNNWADYKAIWENILKMEAHKWDWGTKKRLQTQFASLLTLMIFHLIEQNKWANKYKYVK